MKLEDIKEKTLVVFTTPDCPMCIKLKNELKDFDYPIVYPTNGDVIGIELAISVVPTSVLIESGIEVNRFYGFKKLDYIISFVK